MRVLITGATGLLGSDLCRLLSQEEEVLGWARGVQVHPWGQGRLGSTLESVDITDESSVSDRMAGFRPEVVIHTAAMSDVDACELDPEIAFEVNAQGVGHVAKACAATGAFLIAISTDYVFDGKIPRPYREEDAPHPVSTYGRSKLEGEKLALSLSPRCLVVRVSGLFGSGRPNFVSQSVERFRTGEAVPVVKDHTYSPTYTRDLGYGFQQILKEWKKDPRSADPGGRLQGFLHMANAGGASRLEVAQAIARHLKFPERLIEQTTWAALDRPAKRPANSQLDCSRFSKCTGTPFRSWKESLGLFLEEATLDPKGNP